MFKSKKVKPLKFKIGSIIKTTKGPMLILGYIDNIWKIYGYDEKTYILHKVLLKNKICKAVQITIFDGSPYLGFNLFNWNSTIEHSELFCGIKILDEK